MNYNSVVHLYQLTFLRSGYGIQIQCIALTTHWHVTLTIRVNQHLISNICYMIRQIFHEETSKEMINRDMKF